ncbi:MAG: Hsp20/alpha crystallin family protein [Clostridia bacterium]|nr:Hsp20/alpha crystallin family protein [Clostridia bacterium]
MLMTNFFDNSLLDNFFSVPSDSYRTKSNTTGLMQTDIKESDTEYEIIMNLPGFKKENVKGELKDGYLVVTATNAEDDTDKNVKYLCRERYSGGCSRSFYVGEEITQQDIKARFENGVLTFIVPKIDKTARAKETKFISID